MSQIGVSCYLMSDPYNLFARFLLFMRMLLEKLLYNRAEVLIFWCTLLAVFVLRRGVARGNRWLILP